MPQLPPRKEKEVGSTSNPTIITIPVDCTYHTSSEIKMICIACGGTGKSSVGGICYPCLGTGIPRENQGQKQ